jgi:CelD/BcsL family acetyltransferase involved in cellulose biosynthesis
MSLPPTSAGVLYDSAAATFPEIPVLPHLKSLESGRYTVGRCIESIADFEQMRSDWERVYREDETASLFLSWTWLRGWLNQSTEGICILGVQHFDQPNQPGEYVAFLPLRLTSKRFAGFKLRQLSMLGNSGADYTGMIALPEHESAVLEQLALILISQIKFWDIFYCDDVMDIRIAKLMQLMQTLRSGLQTHVRPGIVCPYLNLPDRWETYLQQSVSPSRRKKLRKALRDLETHPEVTISETSDATLEQDLDDFLQVYQLRWQRSTAELLQLRNFARWCFLEGILWLFVVRLNDQPIAAEMLFYDEKNRAVRGYQRGYDAQFSKLSPGHGAVAYVIRKAIAHQLTTFDFLRGDEGYKAHFGTEERWNQHYSLASNWRGKAYMGYCQLIQRLRSSHLLQAHIKPKLKPWIKRLKSRRRA